MLRLAARLLTARHLIYGPPEGELFIRDSRLLRREMNRAGPQTGPALDVTVTRSTLPQTGDYFALAKRFATSLQLITL